MATFTRTKLSNGIDVICAPMPEATSVTVFVLAHVGSKYEQKRYSGISHFVEHMCFKGTSRRPNTNILSKELDAIGAQYNAFTSQEGTGYYVKVHPKHTSKIIDVLSDLYMNPLFDEKEMEKERKVILEEMRMYEEMPHRHVHDLFAQAMYGDQPAGWNIVGNRKSLAHIRPQHLRDFHTQMYTGNATTIVVAGAINKTHVLKDIRKAFAPLVKGTTPKKKPVEEPQNRPKILIKRKAIDQVHLVLGMRTHKANHKDSPVIKVIDALLGGGMSSRLFQKLREEMAVGYDIKTIIDEYTDHGFFSVYVGLEKSRLIDVVKTILLECQHIARGEFTHEELRKAKEYLIGSTTLSLEQSDSIAEFIGLQEISGEQLRTPAQLIAQIKKVTKEDICRVAKEMCSNDRLVLSLIGDVTMTKKLKDAFRF